MFFQDETTGKKKKVVVMVLMIALTVVVSIVILKIDKHISGDTGSKKDKDVIKDPVNLKICVVGDASIEITDDMRGHYWEPKKIIPSLTIEYVANAEFSTGETKWTVPVSVLTPDDDEFCCKRFEFCIGDYSTNYFPSQWVFITPDTNYIKLGPLTALIHNMSQNTDPEKDLALRYGIYKFHEHVSPDFASGILMTAQMAALLVEKDNFFLPVCQRNGVGPAIGSMVLATQAKIEDYYSPQFINLWPDSDSEEKSSCGPSSQVIEGKDVEFMRPADGVAFTMPEESMKISKSMIEEKFDKNLRIEVIEGSEVQFCELRN